MMQRTVHRVIIQLLVAALVSLGIAQAGGDLCPPDCSHCGVVAAQSVAVQSPCCAGMRTGETAAVPAPVKTGPGSACEHGSYCDTIDLKNDVIPVIRALDSDFAWMTSVTTVAVSIQVPNVRHHAFSLKSPPPGRQPARYTLHCSLLI